MADPKKLKALLLSMTASVALAACSGGASEVASPGEGAFGGDGGAGSGSGGGSGGSTSVTCPDGFTNGGSIDADGTTLRVCRLPNLITGDFVVPLTAGAIFTLSGRVDVGEDRGGDSTNPAAGAEAGTLTIEPGVRLFGSAGADYLVVNRGSRIFAEGTPTQPIVFTSRQSVLGDTTENSIGQWGGIVILGRAPITNCNAAGADPGDSDCQAQVEGTNALYGGNNDADNSGILRYVRVQHSGFTIATDNELNGITFGGVGRSTTVDYVQVHNSSDDGVEFFGGTVNAKHLVMTGNDDESVDTDTGWSGGIQFLLVVQRPAGGDKVFEMSSAPAGRTPPSNPKLVNVTAISRGSSDGIVMNTGTNSVFYNMVFVNTGSSQCLDIDDENLGATLIDTTGTFNSVVMECPGGAFENDSNINAAATQAIWDANKNAASSTSFTNSLTGIFINGAAETAVTPADPTGLGSFFANVGYVGAVKDADDDWWDDWTCSPLIGRPEC